MRPDYRAGAFVRIKDGEIDARRRARDERRILVHHEVAKARLVQRGITARGRSRPVEVPFPLIVRIQPLGRRTEIIVADIVERGDWTDAVNPQPVGGLVRLEPIVEVLLARLLAYDVSVRWSKRVRRIGGRSRNQVDRDPDRAERDE